MELWGFARAWWLPEHPSECPFGTREGSVPCPFAGGSGGEGCLPLLGERSAHAGRDWEHWERCHGGGWLWDRRGGCGIQDRGSTAARAGCSRGRCLPSPHLLLPPRAADGRGMLLAAPDTTGRGAGSGGPWRGVLGLGATCCAPQEAEGAVSQLGTSQGGTRGTEQGEQLALHLPLVFSRCLLLPDGAVGLCREQPCLNTAAPACCPADTPLSLPLQSPRSPGRSSGGWKRCRRPGWL